MIFSEVKNGEGFSRKKFIDDLAIFSLIRVLLLFSHKIWVGKVEMEYFKCGWIFIIVWTKC